MEKKQLIGEIKKHKYIFMGEIHNTKNIPKIVFDLISNLIIEEKILFCLELPKQSEFFLNLYFNNKISKKVLYSSKFLKDSLKDKRLNNNTLILYKKIYKLGIKIKCLEDYNCNPYKRDESMAERLLYLINKYNFDKYITYLGNIHILKKETNIAGFNVKPLISYLPNNIILNSFIINFNRSEKLQ